MLIDDIFIDFSIFVKPLIYKSWDEWQAYLNNMHLFYPQIIFLIKNNIFRYKV